MTYPARIELTNYFRFRSVAVDLGPRAYAVEAELEGDPSRSNWLCKSAFCEAVPFVLNGWHRFQEGERAPGFEDRWVREGENEGGAALVLSDGLRAERTRRRGSSTQLRVTLADGSVAAGDAAQAILDQHVGLSRDDFFSTAFVRQKLCAQLVTASPSGRMGLIADWLDLAKLEEAGRVLAKRVTDRAQERDRLTTRAADLKKRVAELEAEEHLPAPWSLRLDGGSAAHFEEAFRNVQLIAEKALREAEEAFAARGRWDAEERQRAREAALRSDLANAEEKQRSRLAALRADLASAEQAFAALPAPEKAPDISAVLAESRSADAALASARSVARGEFDGRCPVVAGFECPAKAQLNQGGEQARAALTDAQAAALRARTSLGFAREGADAVERRRRERQRAEERVELLRAQVARETESQLSVPASSARSTPDLDLGSGIGGRPIQARYTTESQLSVPGAAPPPGSRAEVEQARQALESLRTQLALFRRSSAELEKLRGALSEVEAQRAAADLGLAHARAARLVVGRGGAQRRIAEAAVGAIARGANARLASIGVDLRVALSWRREGAELASACEACGAGYPRTNRARVCATCGADRGRAVQDRLDVELSDRSGAAEDLAGLALQRAACAFLRRRRGAPWASLVLDEPFGALDERHREAVARSIAAVREEDGFEQVFCVAHDRGILDSLPGKILVRGRGAESVVEVIE